MNANVALRASVWVLKRCRARSSHSRVAKSSRTWRCHRRRRPTHRRAHTCIAAAVAELDRGVLRTLVGVMDHARGPSRQKRHVQSVKHQWRGERGGHRPADDAAMVRIEHDSQIEKAGPGRNVGDIGHPQQIRRFRREIALDQIGCLTTVTPDRGDDELASAHTGEAGLRHQSRHPLASR